MYRILQNAALIVLVILGTFFLSNVVADSNQVLAIQGIGGLLTVLLGADALRVLWRS